MKFRLFYCFRTARFSAGFALSILAGVAWADVTLPKIFGDHMVVQRDREIPVWGKADPGQEVRVSLAEQKASGKAGRDGKWLVRLPQLPAGGPHELIVAGGNTVTINDVLIGDVWVCSGQSNMEWPMTQVDSSSDEISAADHPQIRLFNVQRNRSDEPLDDVSGAWQACTPANVESFSAVAYFFGRHVHQHQNVPVGLLETCWGGTPAEHWTPASAFAGDPSLAKTSDHPHAQEVMKGKSSLYNAMIAPLVPYGIRGAIWYQGESNVPMGKFYHKLFSGMITGWRQEWGQGDFPFLFVQIAPWNYGGINGWPREGCPLVREAQLKTLALPHTGMAVTMDIGDVADIHPRNKQEVGRRLGLAAQAVAYGEDVPWSGPLYESMETQGNKVVLHFDHADGLKAAGDKLLSFEVAGKDRNFVEATAEIVGDTVVVHSEQVSEPAAARYAFSDDALPNLFNAAGLPASPFRTDDWE